MFKKTKISTRLISLFGMLLVSLVLISGLSVFKMSGMNTAMSEVTLNWLPSVEYINTINTIKSDLRITEFQHILNTDEKLMLDLESDMKENISSIEKNKNSYAPLICSENEQKLYNEFNAAWNDYKEVHIKVIDLSRRNQNTQAKALLESDSRLLFEKLEEKLLKLVELNANGAQKASQDAEQSYFESKSIIFIVTAALLVIVIFLVFNLIKSIVGSINQALTVTNRVAAGDFSGTIDITSQDEIGQLLSALSNMQSSLIKVVSTVLQNSESVATASAQIAQGNQDLSQRTEEQASALEQTTATMEELSGTVANNAENAKQANQLAQNASIIAAHGGEVVTQVVTTMQDISESSRKISDIISVIDGIAFQTNILALNASVEAARAGEQGRGFAVVAGEVRTLAQRSANAAQEIKQLINNSVHQVSQGAELVEHAGNTMTDIVNSINRVSNIVSEITSASVEQSSGIQQVGLAITQMDQVTQQNAALVEESAAAAESLRDQAQQLVHTVSVFKLSNNHSTHSSTSRVMGSSPIKLHKKPSPRLEANTVNTVSTSKNHSNNDDWSSF